MVHLNRFAKVIWLVLAMFCLCAAPQAKPADGAAKGKKKKAELVMTPSADDLFSSTQVVRISIEIPQEGLQVLRGYRWNGWRGGNEKRPSVLCTVREGDKVYPQVSIHLKGAAGSFQPVDDNPALTLNFGKNIKGQTFHGLQRLSLNNSVQDRSLLNEQICRELFASAGIPVPRASHAKVQLNGRDLGVYVLVEAFNKQFLARHFKSPNGNLYDGGFLKDVTDELEKSSGPDPADRSDLQRLAEAAMEPEYTNRLARLSRILDLDQFVTYLALDVMMCDWDGYAMNRNNYRIYHDPVADKIVFMPHGLDQMFGVIRASTRMPVFPHMQGMVARAVLQIPEGRALYRSHMSEIMTNLFNVEALTNRIWQVTAQIQPLLAEQGIEAARFQHQEADDFARRIVDRARSIREQLSSPERTLKFDSTGFARIGPWQPRAESGKPLLDETAEAQVQLLHISAANGSCVGVWVAKVSLEPGRYHLEGRVRSQGVTPEAGDRRGGAGLRILGRRFNQKLTGDNGWTNLVFDFEVQDQATQFGFMGPVQDASPDLELICELRAAKGEVWFDRDSLRLSRR